MATAIRFVFTGLRFLPSGAQDGIQLSEVALFGPDGGKLPILAATNPGGQNTNPSQPAGAAVDGLLQTKWFDTAIVASGQSTLQLQLAAPSTLYAYELWTGNDNTKRDPVSWRVEQLEEAPPPPAPPPTSLELLLLNFDEAYGGAPAGCPGCTVNQTTFNDAEGAFEFSAAASSFISAPMPALSADFTVTFFVKFTDACGSEGEWWRGCGLVTAQSDAQPFQHIGCFSDLFSSPDFTPIVPATSLASLQECHTHCQAAGSAFFAMQAAMCSCTNSYGRHGQLSDSNCDSTAAAGCGVNGNGCGGYSRNSIYAAIGTTDFGISVGGGKIIMGVNTDTLASGQSSVSVSSIVSPSSYN